MRFHLRAITPEGRIASLDTQALDEQAARQQAESRGYTVLEVKSQPGLRLIGTARHKASILSFVLDSVHPHDVGTILDYEGVAVRTGHHCAMPVMERYGVPATVRASFAAYNTHGEVDTLFVAVRKALEVFR